MGKPIPTSVSRAKKQGCSLVIVPFTLWTRWSELNADCITKPLDYLRDEGKVKLVYQRKENAKGAKRITKLMKRLGAKEIKSDEDYQRQVDGLWKILVKFDP